jgi:hypothetical protein
MLRPGENKLLWLWVNVGRAGPQKFHSSPQLQQQAEAAASSSKLLGIDMRQAWSHRASTAAVVFVISTSSTS